LCASQAELDTLRGTLSETEKQLSAKTVALGASQAELDMLRGTLSETEKQLSAKTASLGASQAELDTLRGTLSETEKQLSAKTASLDASQSKTSRLESELRAAADKASDVLDKAVLSAVSVAENAAAVRYSELVLKLEQVEMDARAAEAKARAEAEAAADQAEKSRVRMEAELLAKAEQEIAEAKRHAEEVAQTKLAEAAEARAHAAEVAQAMKEAHDAAVAKLKANEAAAAARENAIVVTTAAASGTPSHEYSHAPGPGHFVPHGHHDHRPSPHNYDAHPVAEHHHKQIAKLSEDNEALCKAAAQAAADAKKRHDDLEAKLKNAQDEAVAMAAEAALAKAKFNAVAASALPGHTAHEWSHAPGPGHFVAHGHHDHRAAPHNHDAHPVAEHHRKRMAKLSEENEALRNALKMTVSMNEDSLIGGLSQSVKQSPRRGSTTRRAVSVRGCTLDPSHGMLWQIDGLYEVVHSDTPGPPVYVTPSHTVPTTPSYRADCNHHHHHHHHPTIIIIIPPSPTRTHAHPRLPTRTHARSRKPHRSFAWIQRRCAFCLPTSSNAVNQTNTTRVLAGMSVCPIRTSRTKRTTQSAGFTSTPQPQVGRLSTRTLCSCKPRTWPCSQRALLHRGLHEWGRWTLTLSRFRSKTR
jgi:hypothetical protein